jgi:hypothetical protein
MQVQTELSLAQLAAIAQSKYQDLSVICNGFSGTVYRKGTPVFNTSGPSSESVISAYLSGLINAEQFLK